MIEDLKYADILKKNKSLSEGFESLDFGISILSNTTVHQLKDILELQLRSHNIGADVHLGEYDNIVQESLKSTSFKAVIILYELANLFDSLPFEIELMEDAKIDELYEKLSSELAFTLQNLKSSPLVVMSKFSHIPFTYNSASQLPKLEQFCDRLNRRLEELERESINLKLIEIDKIYSSLSVEDCIDLRYFYSSKMLYSIEFHKGLTNLLTPLFLSLAGKAKKALVLDCDNTLWKGILGEDGFDNIQMSTKTTNGKAFREAQLILKSLAKQGVLLNLCSKNNAEDVEHVLNEHPDMMINQDELIIKKVNWNDKLSNIREIAQELNIGLDSLVFIDDSDFEVNLIRENLPEVAVFQVPKKSYEYPLMLREVSNLFFKGEGNKEDVKRTQMYKEEQKRKAGKEQFGSIDDYISSLDLVVDFKVDDENQIARLAQMTQKTNQFNLTTKRYSEKEIEDFTQSDNYLVMSISVHDKFGEYGITGLSIVELDGKNANIDTLLMSCRILGRRIEEIFFDEIIESLLERDVEKLKAKYIPTKKNMQLVDYLDRMGMQLSNKGSEEKEYKSSIKDRQKIGPDYIEVRRSILK